MRQLYPCAGTMMSLSRTSSSSSSGSLIITLWEVLFRFLLPWAAFPQRIHDQGIITFLVLLKSVFLKSKVGLMCTMLGFLIIMNIKTTRSLSFRDYHCAKADTKPTKRLLRNDTSFKGDSCLFWRFLDTKLSKSLTHQKIHSHNWLVTNKIPLLKVTSCF